MNLRLLLTRILLLPVALLALATHHVHTEGSLLDVSLEAAAIILLVTAAGGRVWASAYVAGRKDRDLVTDGPYSLVRNPLYFFSLVGFIGAGLAFESITLALIFALTFFAAHWPTIRKEERELRRIFGEEYDRYRERVPRFLPAFGRVRTGGTIRLDPARFSLALRDCMAIPLVLVLANAIEWAKLNDLLPVLFLIP